jgi:hypothetical protein
LDVFYLILDVVVAIGFFTGWAIAFVAFYFAAISQIILYTVLRTWIIEVPSEFAVSIEQVAYLDTLVTFHVITIVQRRMAGVTVSGKAKGMSFASTWSASLPRRAFQRGPA